ncbi:MAG: hypothetical protein IJ524_05400 [Bacteroidales bacterium]|nr:hypothetical protein [Bacteroidales bacterium]
MKTKNNFIRIITLLAATLTMAACVDPEGTEPTGTERQIIYAVAHTESRATLKTEAEWDKLLDRFCDYAVEGKEVDFYNLSSQPSLSAKGRHTVKDVVTFSTNNRAEIKEWMKAREKEGKTVNVRFESETGTWTGTAYATAPNHESTDNCYTGVIVMAPMTPFISGGMTGSLVALQVSPDSLLYVVKDNIMYEDPEEVLPGYAVGDTVTLCGVLGTLEDANHQPLFVLDITDHNYGSIAGTWRYVCMAVTSTGTGDYLLNTDLYLPGAGESILYTFLDNGTAEVSVSHDGLPTTTQSGTWSLSDDGMLCCDLMPADGGCWTINWITGSSMIVSRADVDDNGAEHFYQVQFENITE